MSMYEKMAASHPKLAAGIVWCRECHKRREVDAAECLRTGWPKCHGQTMTLDEPERKQ